MAKDPTSLPSSVPSSKVVTTSSQFTFFSNIVEGQPETGLKRVKEFIAEHVSDGLFRQGAYLFIVLISNGRDTEVESPQAMGTVQNVNIFNDRKSALLNLKSIEIVDSSK